MTGIRERAAKTGNGQMRVASLGNHRPDRIVSPDRMREWAAQRYEEADFNSAYHGGPHVHEKWFCQAIGASPATFKRDASGAALDCAHTYRLIVPQPAPDNLF